MAPNIFYISHGPTPWGLGPRDPNPDKKKNEDIILYERFDLREAVYKSLSAIVKNSVVMILYLGGIQIGETFFFY